MDLGIVNRSGKSSADLEGQIESYYDEKLPGSVEKDKHASGFSGSFRLVCFNLQLLLRRFSFSYTFLSSKLLLIEYAIFTLIVYDSSK
jgi:hypothetical protein